MQQTANIDVKILDSRLRDNLPRYATEGSAGIDLMAMIEEPFMIAPGDVRLIPTGLSINLKNKNLAACILPRSGLGTKEGLVLANLVGLIDSDYLGELKIALWNRSNKATMVSPMQRVAQLIIIPVVKAQFTIVDEHATTTERGSGGFGSTGI